MKEISLRTFKLFQQLGLSHVSQSPTLESEDNSQKTVQLRHSTSCPKDRKHVRRPRSRSLSSPGDRIRSFGDSNFFFAAHLDLDQQSLFGPVVPVNPIKPVNQVKPVEPVNPINPDELDDQDCQDDQDKLDSQDEQEAADEEETSF